MTLSNNNISLITIHNILSEPSFDVGTLCNSKNINAFSKWKPVHFSGLTMNETYLKSINYGINVVSSSSINGIVNAVSGGTTHTYEKPRGGVNSPYRLGDFRNYNSTAPLPVRPLGARDIDNGAGVTTLITIENQETATTLGKDSIYNFFGENGDKMLLNRGIHMKNEAGGTAYCTNSIDWTKINNPTQWRGEVICTDFYCNFSKSIGEIRNGLGTDRYYAVVSDKKNPNPYKWFLTGNLPAGSKKYFFTIQCYKELDNKQAAIYSLTMSTIGDVYAGGTAANISIQINTKSNGTGTAISNVNIASSYTIAEESYNNWEGSVHIPSTYQDSVLYAIVYADNAIQTRTAILMPMP